MASSRVLATLAESCLKDLSPFGLTPVSLIDNWYFLSFNCTLTEDAEPLGPDAILYALQRILAKYEQKLRLSLICNTSMAENALRSLNGNTDWNHAILLLTVYDRICWYLNYRNLIESGRPLRLISLSAPATVEEPMKGRWKEDLQRFYRGFGNLRDPPVLPSAVALGLHKELLFVATHAGTGYRASVESRLCLAALGVCSLVVRRQLYSHRLLGLNLL